MNTYALIYTMVDADKSAQHRTAHVEFLRHLVRTGKIETGWKFPDYQAGQVQGMLICKAASADEVRGWFAQDPVIVSGARTFQVLAAQAMSVGA